MATATITLKDEGDEINVKFDFSPRIEDGSQAHTLAARIIDFINSCNESAPADTLRDAAQELTPAARDVLVERRRQIEAEGWEPEHDDEHVNDEIAALATFYAMPPAARDWPALETGYGDTFGKAIIPFGWVARAGDRRRDLVKAGALILAEIERLDRATVARAEGAQ